MDVPPQSEGLHFFDALDLNWGTRMSRVQAAGNPYCAEVCEAGCDRSCTVFATSLTTSMYRDFPLPPIGHLQGQFESGLAAGTARSYLFWHGPAEHSEPESGLCLPSKGGRQLRFPATLPMYLESCATFLRDIEALHARMQRNFPLPPILALRRQGCAASMAASED